MSPSEVAVYVERVLRADGLDVKVSYAGKPYEGLARMHVKVNRISDKSKVVRDSFDQPLFEGDSR